MESPLQLGFSPVPLAPGGPRERGPRACVLDEALPGTLPASWPGGCSLSQRSAVISLSPGCAVKLTAE